MEGKYKSVRLKQKLNVAFFEISRLPMIPPSLLSIDR